MEAIASSDAAVALVSQDFLKSGFISEAEVPLLARRHRESRNQLFCMYVRHSTVTDHLYEDNGHRFLLTDFQGLNDPNEVLHGLPDWERECALVEISSKLHKYATRQTSQARDLPTRPRLTIRLGVSSKRLPRPAWISPMFRISCTAPRWR